VTRSNRLWSAGLALAAAFSAGMPARAQVGTSPPAAQPAAPASVPLAESLKGTAKSDYDSGRILFQDGDHAGALVKFQHAFEESGDHRLLWNMAVCEKNLRHYAAVLKLLARYRQEGEARMTEAHRMEVNEVLQTVHSLVSMVRVVVNEPGASIYVDGTKAGTAPLAEPLVVDLGKRSIRVAKSGFVEQTMVQEFAGGSETTFNVVLVAEPKKGRLSITAAAGDVIHVDGKVVGERHFQGVLLPGEHVLRVTADGKRPYTKDVTLAPGESRELHVTLETESKGIPTVIWVGAGVLVAAGLGVGGYFLFRPEPTPQEAATGTLGQVNLPLGTFR
jgi:hypothetical protein